MKYNRYCLCCYSPRHEDVWGSGGTAPRLFNFVAGWREVIRFTPPPLNPRRRSPRYPLARGLGGARNRSGRCGEEKNSLPPSGIKPQSSSPWPSHYDDWANRAVCTSSPYWKFIHYNA